MYELGHEAGVVDRTRQNCYVSVVRSLALSFLCSFRYFSFTACACLILFRQ